MATSLSPSTPPTSQLLTNVKPAPRPSLSESALPSRRIILRANNSKSTLSNNVVMTPSSSMGVRPSRFVKPTPSSSQSLMTTSSSTTTATTTTTTTTPTTPTTATLSTSGNRDMDSFVHLFDEYSQKVYMEGYLMHQDKKYFVELCGMTLALWDIDRPGNVVTPTYIPIMVDTKASPTTQRQQFTLDLAHKKKSMVFDTLDPASLTKWICAVHLACFERHFLHQYFTLHLFTSTHLDKAATTSTCSAGYLQVLLPSNKNEWKKLWVVVAGGDTDRKASSSSSKTQHEPHLTILETKKSKTPLLELKRVDHAYAVYPESASLISKSTLVRLEGVSQQGGQCIDILLMADSMQHMTQWLSTLYNTFKLYGRPQALVQDPMDPVALNFGELLPDTIQDETTTDQKQQQYWWLETEDVIQDMDVFTSNNKTEIHQRLINTLQQKQVSSSPLQQQQQQLQLQQQHTSYSQQRANSLPLITVESMDPPRQRSTSDAGILNDPSIRPALHSHVADSSDESDGDQEEDDDEEEELDSDDEPIGKSKPAASQPRSSSTKKGFSSLLIPDFDFGNGFDTDRRESTAGSILLSGRSSPTTSDIMSRPSSRQQQQHPNQSSRLTQKSKANNSSNSTTTSSSSGNSVKGGVITNKKPASSSLFGDFSLTTDFNKYLDPASTPSRTSTPDRKYSLAPNIKYGERTGTPTSHLSSGSGMERRASSWDDYRLGWDDHPSPRVNGGGGGGGRYMNEDYIYQYTDDDDDDDHRDNNKPRDGGDDDDDSDQLDDTDGPLIPSLNDHFAPRNSLLDSHAGEQLSAKEQIEYARATGQPLIQMPSKPRPPKGGLVGVISQREKHRRQGKGTRVAERVNQHHADLFEREKERRIMEQRQQQYMQHQIMMYAQNGYVHPMHPYMTPPPPGNVLGSPTMGSPGSPYTSHSPIPSSNGYFYGRPYSPSSNSYFGGGAASTMYPSSPSSPHQPFIHISSNHSGSGSSGGGSVGRRNSRPLLSEEDDEDEPLCSPLMAYQFQQQQQQQNSRTASPTFYHKMQPVPSSSTGTSSLRL